MDTSLPQTVSASSNVNINRALFTLLGVLTVAFIGLIYWDLRDTSAKEGGVAPDFSIHSDQGREVALSSFKGKVLVLNFWATWCVPCVQEVPSLSRFQQKFRDSGVVVFAISVDKNPQKYATFLSRFHVSFETARDPDANVSTKYGTFQFPESYIIKDGRVMRKFASAEDWMSDDMTQYVQSLL